MRRRARPVAPVPQAAAHRSSGPGWLAEHGADRRPTLAFLAFCGGQLAVFGIGVPWLQVSTGMSWGDAIHDGFALRAPDAAWNMPLGCLRLAPWQERRGDDRSRANVRIADGDAAGREG